ncbi:MAG: nucleoside 2-deoxyribosyltransferase [Candidatus Magasanikbacteria bacterium]|nr:nucleoside 2-deoxyribosyltransferase [Candidatus Magasanikbacteria bacterium]
MNIYFIGAIRGGRIHQPQYSEIVSGLKKYGTVLSAQVADETISDYGETNLTKEEIHDRELELLKTSDVVVAEVTVPSLGVGYLIAQALNLNKRVCCLYWGENTYKLSAMIKGNKMAKVYLYRNRLELADVLQKIFN